MIEINKIHLGDCLKNFPKIPDQSVDLIFLDPPYNLQLNKELTRPNHSVVKGVDHEWDKFENFNAYDQFSKEYLSECRRVLKDDGSLWVIGSYHNIFRIGKIIQDLNFWILNDVIWEKSNPLPNFRATRLTNAHETIIWCSKNPKAKYQFNYHTLKTSNEDKQERSVWNFPICSGKERLKNNDNQTAHPTQKPLALMKKIILQSSIKGDLLMEPFAGTASFCAAAKYLGRNFIGFEQDKDYHKLANKRLKSIKPLTEDLVEISEKDKPQKKIPFGSLINSGYLEPGSNLYNKNKSFKAKILPDGSLTFENDRGSIHKIAAKINNTTTFNGWDYWHYEDSKKKLISINEIRKKIRN